jgi:UDP-glucose 4-epimerase
MKIAVFGGAGFIGSHLVDNFLAKGHTVIIFDRFYKKELWDEYGWSQNSKVHLFLGDLKDRDSVIEAVNQTDRWVNLAGLLGTSEMVNNPIPAVEVNIIGALNIFDAARLHKRPGLQIEVGNYWMNNPYSITRSTTGRFAQMYNKEHGTDIRLVRGMNVYGERQKHRPVRKIFPNTVIPALHNKPITVYGTGEQVMDLIYVKDIAEVLARALLVEKVPNDLVFEAGVGGDFTINQAVRKVLDLTGSSSQILYKPMRQGEDKISVVQISEEGWGNLGKYLNYTPHDLTPMDTAFAQSIQWYKTNLHRFPWDE